MNILCNGGPIAAAERVRRFWRCTDSIRTSGGC